jgi:hypothetical protein
VSPTTAPFPRRSGGSPTLVRGLDCQEAFLDQGMVVSIFMRSFFVRPKAFLRPDHPW